MSYTVKSNPLAKPLLMISVIVICLAMVRLGVWQLDRAEQKRTILAAQQEQTELPALDLTATTADSSKLSRFRQVRAAGNYLVDKSVFLDNQVHNGSV